MSTGPSAQTPDEAAVWEALRKVLDPEVGENVVDLGLVYRVACAPGKAAIEMTMTSPACPLGDVITDDVTRQVRAACGDACEVEVNIVFDPPWTPERMSESARRRFGW
jgi:metal-sulfur cluster biosynthetic enzyme